ncbi:hypothetical protein HZB69_04030 [Candidatus Amesbacteria bacterium]|nr:hypothetical protein [Candidatus Amesbacteria bacterium]
MRNKIILILVLGLGLLTRSYQYRDRASYTHDNDLAGWVIKDILVDKHVRLIGQLTSSPGIYIGGLFYYLQIPFYWLANMDPIGGVWLSITIGLLGVASMWYVAGFTPSLIYALSFLISNTEREVVPTTPVFLWSIWFFHTFVQLWKGNKKWLYVVAILVSLIWHFNLALILGVPLLLLAFLKHIKTYSPKEILLPILLCFVLNLPLLIFEVRHGFTQTRALFGTLTTVGGKSVYTDRLGKLTQTIRYTLRNANRIFIDDSIKLNQWIIPSIILGGILLFSTWRWLMVGWMAMYIAFFSLHPLPLSEYYLNGMTIVWILGAGLLLKKLPKPIVAIILTLFLYHNLDRLFSYQTNHAGYIERKAIVSFIKEDADKNNYPCVSVSYITSPGNNFGYRYWFWYFKLKTMRPDSLAPVYSIVFPHGYVDRMDKTFGSLGLIFPDYSRYTKEGITKSCSIPDQNLTESMFGFTK